MFLPFLFDCSAQNYEGAGRYNRSFLQIKLLFYLFVLFYFHDPLRVWSHVQMYIFRHKIGVSCKEATYFLCEVINWKIEFGEILFLLYTA